MVALPNIIQAVAQSVARRQISDYSDSQPNLTLISKDAWVPEEIKHAMREKKSNLAQTVKAILPFIDWRLPYAREMVATLIDRLSSCVVVETRLWVAAWHWDERVGKFVFCDYGMMGEKVVTTAGVNYLVDALQNLVEPENQKYHGIGTGTGAEAVGDTALGTELTTEYNPDNTRATGTTTEGATANIYRTVATNTLDGTPGAAIREHGVFSAASAGTLLDRTLMTSPGVTLSSGESLQSTYDMTLTAGS